MLIAVAVVVMLVIGSVVYLVIDQSGNNKYRSTDDSGRLMVFGNANNDDYIDSKDIDTLREIIEGDLDETKYADANQDGKIDEKDIQKVQDIIDKKTDKVFICQIHNGAEQVVDCKYPLKKVCVSGYETITMIKTIGAVEGIVCLAGASGATFNERFYSDVYDLPKVGIDIWNVDLELLSNYVVDAVITMDSSNYVSNYGLIESAGIDVIRVQAANGLTSLNGIVTLGFLMDSVDRANDAMEFFDGILKDITSKVAKIPVEDRVTAIFVTMSNYIEGQSKNSQYTETMEIAGAVSVADSLWGDAARKQFFIGDEWLLNERYQTDFIVHSRALGLGDVDVKSSWDTYTIYFTELDAFKSGGYFQLNSTLSPVLRIVCMAGMFYPDVFGEDYAVKAIQEYYDKFITNVVDFDASDDAIWMITEDTPR